MRILIAEDEPVERRFLEATLASWGYEVTVTTDGAAAWQALQKEETPPIAILDWNMPGLTGVEVCRRVRAEPAMKPIYLIILTSTLGGSDSAAAALEAGADDFVTKPFDRHEMQARIQAGVRIVELELALAGRVRELEAALAEVRQLTGLLPICSYCKKIRDDRDRWHQVESYIAQRTEAQFSHSICPDCYENVVRPQLEEFRSRHQPDGEP